MPQQGLGGWFNSLLPRDKLIYSFLLGLVVVIIGIFTALSWQLFIQNGGGQGVVDQTTAPTSAMTTPPVGGQNTTTVTATPSATTTATPSTTPTIGFLPTLPPSPVPTTPFIPVPLPTIPATPPVVPTNTIAPTDTAVITPTIPTATVTLIPTTPTVPATLSPTPPVVEPATPTDSVLTATNTPEPPTSELQPTAPSPTEAAPPGEELPIQTPSDGQQGATTPPGMPSTGAPPGTAATQQYLTLYFGDATGTLYVPVARLSTVVLQQVETALLRELVAGPRGDLKRLVPNDIKILGVNKSRDGSTITANFDRRPSLPNDDRGLFSIALTLTELPGVRQVQLQVNGRNIGMNGGSAPIRRQAFNIDNPQKLAEDFQSGNRFLPLYFTSNGNRVRITRIHPRTTEVAQVTTEELLKGAGVYSNRLERPIPADTRLLRIWKSGEGVVVDLSSEFTTAANRNAALDTLVLSLTELRDSNGNRFFRWVEVLIEGQKLSKFWGGAYDRKFERPLVNPE